MWQSPIPLPRLRGVPRASTKRTVYGCAESAGVAGLSGADEPERVTAGVRGVAQHGAAVVARVGGAVTELRRHLAACRGRRCAGNGRGGELCGREVLPALAVDSPVSAHSSD